MSLRQTFYLDHSAYSRLFATEKWNIKDGWLRCRNHKFLKIKINKRELCGNETMANNKEMDPSFDTESGAAIQWRRVFSHNLPRQSTRGGTSDKRNECVDILEVSVRSAMWLKAISPKTTDATTVFPTFDVPPKHWLCIMCSAQWIRKTFSRQIEFTINICEALFGRFVSDETIAFN